MRSNVKLTRDFSRAQISRRLFAADTLTLKQESRGATNEIKSGSISPASREPAGWGQELGPVTFDAVSHTCDGGKGRVKTPFKSSFKNFKKK